jgi:hypothetical protein
MSDVIESNIVMEVIEDLGGYSVVARAMGGQLSAMQLKEVAMGRRVPGETNRRRLVKVSRGRLTEKDIIAITGRETHDSGPKFLVHPMWDADEDDLRHWIWQTSVDGARAQLKANRRRRRS